MTLSPISPTLTIWNTPDQKLPALCDVILRRMVGFEVKDDRFEIYREQYARSYQNFEKEQPYQHAMYHQVKNPTCIENCSDLLPCV